MYSRSFKEDVEQWTRIITKIGKKYAEHHNLKPAGSVSVVANPELEKENKNLKIKVEALKSQVTSKQEQIDKDNKLKKSYKNDKNWEMLEFVPQRWGRYQEI